MKERSTNKNALLVLLSGILLSSCCGDYLTEYWYNGAMTLIPRSNLEPPSPDTLTRQHFFLEVRLDANVEETGSYDCGEWVDKTNNSIEGADVSMTNMEDLTVIDGEKLFEVQRLGWSGLDLVPLEPELIPHAVRFTVIVTTTEPLSNGSNTIRHTSETIYLTD